MTKQLAAQAKPKTKAKRLTNKTYSYWLMAPGLTIYIIIFAIPTLASFYFALTRWDLINAEFIGLQNFITFFTQRNTSVAIPHTFIYAFGTCLAKVVFGLLIAVGLSSSYVRSKTYLKSLVYFPTMLSAVAVGITFSALMHPTNGLFNAVLSLFGADPVKWLTDGDIALYSVMAVDFWKGIGVSTVIYLAGLGAIPKDYYEAADLDGAGPVKRFFKVTLPLMVPSINSVLTLSLIGGLKSYELLWTMTEGGPGYSTEILGTVTYKLFARGNYGIATAGNVVMFVIICLIVFPLNSYISKKAVSL